MSEDKRAKDQEADVRREKAAKIAAERRAQMEEVMRKLQALREDVEED